MHCNSYALLFGFFFASVVLGGERLVLSESLVYLRSGDVREWSDFPEQSKADHLEMTFNSPANAVAWTLEYRQQDVKQAWKLLLNGKPLGKLEQDENDMVVYLPVPPGGVTEGKNFLRIEADGGSKGPSDDIRVGEFVLHSADRQGILKQALLEIEVLDAETRQPLPARVTIVRENGAMQTVGAVSDDHLAVRPGTVYTADGIVRCGLPTGRYRIYAGRGFEYSLASEALALESAQTVRRSLSIRREVPTEGYVACDTHVHTLTHSGHGDATIEERMITLAGEGVELPIATDHNVHIDHDPVARRLNLRKYFTPVIGNEVTTPVGHFNIFPVARGGGVPDFKSTDWQALLTGIERVPGVKVAILNHARDLHSGVRPFGPKLYNAASGTHLDGRALRVNAMEVVNSGAIQTDGLRLFHDWMTQLNRGRRLTPVGSSDSHDVARYFVGQARTYIRCDDRDPGRIDVDAAVASFLQGRVMVSYGLAVETTVNGKYRPGELAAVPDEEVRVDVRVLGPTWIQAASVTLYQNGLPIREAEIPAVPAAGLPAGIKWQGDWKIPRPAHDVHLVVIAVGPAVDGAWWKTSKPYQPESTEFTPHVYGASGAVWLDVDRDGRGTPAFDYARTLVLTNGTDLSKLLAALAKYDAAVSIQAASLLHGSTTALEGADAQQTLKAAPAHVRQGFNEYLDAWRATQRAQIEH